MTGLRKQNGQALVLVTFSAVALFGMIGLAMDLGWAYYSRKAAQSAADAAAMAAAQATLAQAGQGGIPVCGTPGTPANPGQVHVVCQPATPCTNPATRPPASPMDNGCLYAERNGFTHGGANGRQTVSLESGISVPPPLAPGVKAHYWVTARVGQDLPQTFSTVLGRSRNASASATAAVVDLSIYGSLMLLNREIDCLPMAGGQDVCGVNLLVSANDNQGHPALQADGGIFMASMKNGQGADGRYAGENTGGGTIKAPLTSIQGSGSYMLSGSARWIETPVNHGNPDNFVDPMRGKGQPKPPTGLTDQPVRGGVIKGSSNANSPLILQPGNYFATNADGTAATGDPISIEGNVRFGASGSGFGQYVLYGGVSISKQSTTVTFDPGMYVFAGTKTGASFSITSNASVRDLTSGFGANTDAGELFVFTDTKYRGQGVPLEVPALVRAVAGQLQQGRAGIQTGSNSNVYLNLHGLNRSSAQIPESLKAFSPVMMWQDQANSVVKYTETGEIDTSCGNPVGCRNTSLASAASTEMHLQGSPTTHIYGLVYQPRGGWISIQGGGDYQVPVQVIAGALRIQGNSNFSMVQPVTPITRRTVALVQ